VPRKICFKHKNKTKSFPLKNVLHYPHTLPAGFDLTPQNDKLVSSWQTRSWSVNSENTNKSWSYLKQKTIHNGRDIPLA